MPSLPKPLAKLFDALKEPAVYLPILLVVVLILLAVAGYFVFGSWLISIVVVLAIALLALMVVLLRTLFGKEKEERLQRGIDDQKSPEELTAASAARAEGIPSIEESFARAVADIRNSRLGTGGLQAMSWVAVVGETGSGKSTLLREAELSVPAGFASRLGAGPGRSCEWWLANEAIAIDTPGRLFDSDDETARAEWLTLLRLLRRRRPACSLNGLVIAIPVTTLFGKSADELEESALSLRRRINEMQDELALDVPIYIVITKADLIEGFVELARSLTPAQSREALGWTNSRRHFANAEELISAGLGEISTRIEGLLPELMLREPDPRARRRLFSFPQELDEAIAAASRFLGRAFAPSAYDEVPFLRGVYFTSGQRTGTTMSPMLHRLGQDWARNTVDGACAEGGLFIRDLLHELIIGDKDVAIPIDTFGPRARRLTHLAAGLASLAMISWWSIGGTSNWLGIRSLRSEASAVIAGASEIARLEALRKTIREQQADLTWVRRAGLGGPMENALERGKEIFVWGFGREFESPTKARLQSVVRGDNDRAFQGLAELAQDVSWISVRATEGGAVTRPDLASYAHISQNDAEVAAFRAGYDDFLRWVPEPEIRVRIERERELVAGAAARLLELQRLESWSERSGDSYPPARYEESGIPVPEGETAFSVPGAYTRKGWEGLVAGLIDAVDRTGGAPARKVSEFRRNYVKRYDTNWRSFLLDTPLEPVAAADVKRSPYVTLVEQIHTNTSADLPREGETPPWIGVLRAVVDDEAPAPAEGEKGETAPWQRYRDALAQAAADVAVASEQSEQALEIAERLAGRQDTSFSAALALVRQLVTTEGDPIAAAKLRQILSMPILNGASELLRHAVVELDGRWRDQVADPYDNSLNAQQMEALYGSDGDLDRFRDQTFKPYYDSRPKEIIGDRSLPFGPIFLDWMSSAQALQKVLGGSGGGGSVSARLEGIPSRVISGEPVQVSRREIRLVCDEGIQLFRYLGEGSGSHSFRWSTDCTELSVRIWALGPDSREFELLPRQEWNGPLALPTFLQLAKRGAGRRFQWQIRYEEPQVELMVPYRLRGGDAILAIEHRVPPRSMQN